MDESGQNVLRTPLLSQVHHETNSILRIVCVTHYFASRLGGIEAVASETNRRLAKRGFLIDWFASATSPSPENIEAVFYHPMRAVELVEKLFKLPLPIWITLDIRKLYQAIRNCDVVQVHDFIYPGSMLAIAFSCHLRKKVILTQHIGEIPYQNKILSTALSMANRIFSRIAFRKVSQVVFISNSVENYFRAISKFHIPPLYIPNGVDERIFFPTNDEKKKEIRARLGISDGARVCLFVGRFVEKKGLLLLAQLVKATPDLQWIFAGSGPIRPEKWLLNNVQVFEGFRRERLADLYRAADLLVLPSRGEGFPLVVQESFACGTPALVSDETAMGCEEARSCLFEAPVTGPEVVKKWEEKLHRFFSDPDALTRHRAVVSEFARTHWNWDRTVDAYARLYSDE
jgi:glycosyltransferase involved in cell wall biosynthesis